MSDTFLSASHHNRTRLLHSSQWQKPTPPRARSFSPPKRRHSTPYPSTAPSTPGTHAPTPQHPRSKSVSSSQQARISDSLQNWPNQPENFLIEQGINKHERSAIDIELPEIQAIEQTINSILQSYQGSVSVTKLPPEALDCNDEAGLKESPQLPKSCSNSHSNQLYLLAQLGYSLLLRNQTLEKQIAALSPHRIHSPNLSPTISPTNSPQTQPQSLSIQVPPSHRQQGLSHSRSSQLVFSLSQELSKTKSYYVLRIEELQEQIKSISLENERLLIDVNSWKKKWESGNDVAKELRDKLEETKSELAKMDSLEREFSACTAKIGKLESELYTLTESYHILENQHLDLMRNHNGEIDDAQEQIKQLRSENSQLVLTNSLLSRQLFDYETKYVKSSRQVLDLMRDLEEYATLLKESQESSALQDVSRDSRSSRLESVEDILKQNQPASALGMLESTAQRLVTLPEAPEALLDLKGEFKDKTVEDVESGTDNRYSFGRFAGISESNTPSSLSSHANSPVKTPPLTRSLTASFSPAAESPMAQSHPRSRSCPRPSPSTPTRTPPKPFPSRPSLTRSSSPGRSSPSAKAILTTGLLPPTKLNIAPYPTAFIPTSINLLHWKLLASPGLDGARGYMSEVLSMAEEIACKRRFCGHYERGRTGFQNRSVKVDSKLSSELEFVDLETKTLNESKDDCRSNSTLVDSVMIDSSKWVSDDPNDWPSFDDLDENERQSRKEYMSGTISLLQSAIESKLIVVRTMLGSRSK